MKRKMSYEERNNQTLILPKGNLPSISTCHNVALGVINFGLTEIYFNQIKDFVDGGTAGHQNYAK